MGFLDGLKNLKNAVTGGAAKVAVEASGARLAEPFQVTVRAVSQGVAVKYSRVYLIIEGVESVDVPDCEIKVSQNGASQTHKGRGQKSGVSVRHEVNIASAGEIAPDQTGEWTAEVRLPAGALPEFRGKYSKHEYRVFAGLDCTGNDPDSGWQPLRLS